MADTTRKQRIWRALSPYLLTLAIALPFAVYYFLALRGPASRLAPVPFCTTV